MYPFVCNPLAPKTKKKPTLEEELEEMLDTDQVEQEEDDEEEDGQGPEQEETQWSIST